MRTFKCCFIILGSFFLLGFSVAHRASFQSDTPDVFVLSKFQPNLIESLGPFGLELDSIRQNYFPNDFTILSFEILRPFLDGNLSAKFVFQPKKVNLDFSSLNSRSEKEAFESSVAKIVEKLNLSYSSIGIKFTKSPGEAEKALK